MIYINRVFKRINPEEAYVLIDYDRTLTADDSTTTWGMLEENSMVSIEYTSEQKEYYEKYRKEEIELRKSPEKKFQAMQKWAEKSFEIIKRYRVCEDTINRALSSNHGMKLRSDSKEFLRKMHMLGVPVIIISAGLGVFIEKYLEQQNSLFDNITIHSNFFIYENGRVISVKQPMLHSSNKDKVDYQSQIGSRTEGILFGDQIDDIKTSQGKDMIKVGFCDTDTYNLKDYNENFDITLTGESSFDNIGKIIIKKYR